MALAVTPRRARGGPHPAKGSLLLQTLQRGAVQIGVSGSVNLMLVLDAAGITTRRSRSERCLLAQRYVMGTVPGALALRIAFTERRQAMRRWQPSPPSPPSPPSAHRPPHTSAHTAHIHRARW